MTDYQFKLICRALWAIIKSNQTAGLRPANQGRIISVEGDLLAIAEGRTPADMVVSK